MTLKSSSSTLEKLARGLKSIGRSRTDVTEMISDDTPPPVPEKTKSLRKMKSMGSLEARKGSQVDVAAAAEASRSFNVDQMRMQRMKYEANIVAAQKFSTSHSQEV
jgi:hypothetical protein